jgi:hypothetical protein
VTIKYTAQAGGYFRVLVDGAEVSKHTTEREALERAENEEQLDPSRDIVVTHDGYNVKVESDEVPLDIADGEVAELTLVANPSELVRIAGTIMVQALAPTGSVKLNLVRIR